MRKKNNKTFNKTLIEYIELDKKYNIAILINFNIKNIYVIDKLINNSTRDNHFTIFNIKKDKFLQINNNKNIFNNIEYDYILIINSYISSLTKNWDNYFIDKLLKKNNNGCLAPSNNSKNFITSCKFISSKLFEKIDYLDMISGETPDMNIISGGILKENINLLYINKNLEDLYILENNLFGEKEEILLSVGLPTLYSREKYLKRLLYKLSWISYPYTNNIEIIIDKDNKEKTIGQKRNDIINRAKGKYFCFIDDDDLVSEDYFDEIFKGIDEDVDGIGFKGIYYVNNILKKYFLHSSIISKDNYICRYLNHLNPVKLEIVKKVKYKHIRCGEDSDYTDRLRQGSYILKEYFSDKFLYHYIYDNNNSETK